MYCLMSARSTNARSTFPATVERYDGVTMALLWRFRCDYRAHMISWRFCVNNICILESYAYCSEGRSLILDSGGSASTS